MCMAYFGEAQQEALVIIFRALAGVGLAVGVYYEILKPTAQAHTG